MRRFALIWIVVISLAPVVWTQPAVLAQDDAPTDVAQLEDEVRILREEVGLLKDQVARLEERLAALEGAPAPTGGEVAGAEELAGAWVESSSSAVSNCFGGNFVCADKYEWRNLELRPDRTYVWGETPYENGSYEVFPAGGSSALDINHFNVVLVGNGGLQCHLIYDGLKGSMWVTVSQCPGMFVEANKVGAPAGLVELNNGSITFSPTN